jgi:predicted nucleic acid-binding protein
LILLDTSALIELLKGNPAITDAVREGEARGEDTGFSSISLFELLQSVHHRKQPEKERRIRGMAAQAIVLPLDSAAAEEGAKIMGSLLRVGRPVNALDVLIAATAVANGARSLISADRDFLEIAKVTELEIRLLR